MTRSFDVFFDLRLNEWLSKQSRGWWFETPSRPLWRHSNGSTWCYVVKQVPDRKFASLYVSLILNALVLAMIHSCSWVSFSIPWCISAVCAWKRILWYVCQMRLSCLVMDMQMYSLDYWLITSHMCTGVSCNFSFMLWMHGWSITCQSIM